MKHMNIAASLGWKNVEDLTEGVHLQPEEAKKIDADLALLPVANTALENANASIGVLTAENEAYATAATAASDKAIADAGVIAHLQSEVTRLGATPSGNGSVLSTKEDVVVEEQVAGAKPRFDSAEHPANKFADSSKKYDRGY
jgi:hypothetical protein